MRVLTFLRSRRLAIILLVGLTIYAWVTTLVPLESVDPALVVQWDAQHPRLAVLVSVLGLHRAYSSPVFLAAALLVTLSTAACSWERTRWAWRAWRARGVVTPSVLAQLQAQPTLVISQDESHDRETVLEIAAGQLRTLGLRVRRGPSVIEGSSGALGYLGSPLFHWALVGLFLFAGLGQFMRYEGYANILVGETRADVPGSYAVDLNAGRLPTAFTGLALTVKEIDLEFSADGVARGAVPYVTLADGNKQLREQWVYANNPLRYGPLLVHGVSVGAAFVGTVKVEQTNEQERIVLYFDPANPTAATFELPDPVTGSTIRAAVTQALGQRVTVVSRVGSLVTSQTVADGQTAVLSEGVTLSVEQLTEYAQIKVVNDWSVMLVYAMFVLVCIGSALTVFAMPRVVRVIAMDAPDGSIRIHAQVSHRKNDPAFRGRVQRALSQTDSAAPPTENYEELQ